MGLEPLFRLAAASTVNQLLRRNDFAERIGDRPPDLRAGAALPADAGATTRWRCAPDVELGGTDQLFNLMLAPRDPAASTACEPQVVMTMPILPAPTA